MTTPEVVRFADDYFRKVVYGLGPYIADYPEQALLACIVQGWCPRCTAPSSDLDSDKHGRRSKAHTEMLVEEFELGMLWDEYGLVGDIVVRSFFSPPCTYVSWSVHSRWPIRAPCTAPHCVGHFRLLRRRSVNVRLWIGSHVWMMCQTATPACG